MTQHSTDTRLDALGQRTDASFKRIDEDIRVLRSETNARFETIETKFDALQRTLLLIGGGVMVALLGVIATQL
jgi:hypothetical protein